MSRTFVIIFLCIAVTVVLASDVDNEGKISAKSNCPGHPNHCYDKETKDFFEQDSELRPRKGMCEGVICWPGYMMEIKK